MAMPHVLVTDRAVKQGRDPILADACITNCSFLFEFQQGRQEADTPPMFIFEALANLHAGLNRRSAIGWLKKTLAVFFFKVGTCCSGQMHPTAFLHMYALKKKKTRAV